MTVADVMLVRPAAHGSAGAKKSRTTSLGAVVLAWAFAITVFAPSIIRVVAAPRLVITTLALLVTLTESSAIGKRASRWVFIIVLPYVLITSVLLTQFRLGAPNSFNIQRLIIETPLCLAAGYLVAKSGRSQIWARALVCVGVVNAVLAMFEYSFGRSLLGRSVAFALNERDGGVRALLAADHSLVLGAMLAVCVPLVRVSKFRWGPVLAFVLVAGSLATGSRGPTLLAALVAVTYVVPRSEQTLRRHYRALIGATAVLLAGIAAMSVFVWQPIANGQIGTSYSTDYRTALYAEMPRIVESHPAGYGFGGLPPGEWLIESRLFGVQDVAVTIDSEVVLSASNFGIFGIAAFLATFGCCLFAVRSDAYLGLAGVVVCFTGLFLALHAWDSLGPLWYFLTGTAAYLVRTSPHRAERRRRERVGSSTDRRVWDS